MWLQGPEILKAEKKRLTVSFRFVTFDGQYRCDECQHTRGNTCTTCTPFGTANITLLMVQNQMIDSMAYEIQGMEKSHVLQPSQLTCVSPIMQDGIILVGDRLQRVPIGYNT